MTRFGLDSTSEVPAAAHHAIGSSVALRYLSRYSWKVISRVELEQCRAHGLDLVLVFEDSAGNAFNGYDAGKADAEFARRQALDILGAPLLDPCIRFAVDEDPTGRSAQTDAYFDGVAAVMHRSCAGPYGGDEVIRRQADRGFEQLWPTYAWSHGRVDPRALLRGCYQYSNDHTVGGVGVDFNHIYGVDFGQWDRRPPAPVDPQHYLRFDTRPRDYEHGQIFERTVVKEYDRLRAHPFIHRPALARLRAQCHFLALRIVTVAHEDPVPHPAGFGADLPSWGKFYRGWRVQQLLGRAQGRRFA